MEGRDYLAAVAQVGHLLDENEIPNVVGYDWNFRLFGVYVGTEGQNIQFVVPDEHVSKANAVIANARLALNGCENKTCQLVHHNAGSPIAEKHFHGGSGSDSPTVFILKKSTTYWALPDLLTGSPDADNQVFMLSNHSLLPKAATRAVEFEPFKILTPAALIESMIMLICRDIRKEDRYYTICWEQYF